MRKTAAVLAAALALGAVSFGCSKNPNDASLGTIVLRLTDAPGNFEQVNLVIHEVSIHRGAEDGGTWETLDQDSTSFDLMTLRNGVFATLAVAELPAGHYSQIRLKLGAGSTVMVDGATYPLEVPSGLQSGYKLVGGFDVPAGGLLELTLDFDAARSIVLTGNHRYKLKPTVRVVTTTSAGAITGHVTPTVPTSVYAVANDDTLQSGETGTDGGFTLGSLPGGTYAIEFHPSEGYRDTTLTGVVVNAGATTDVGEVVLTSQ